MTEQQENRLRRKLKRIVDKKLQPLRTEVDISHEEDQENIDLIETLKDSPKEKIFLPLETIIKELKNDTLSRYHEIDNIFTQEFKRKLAKTEQKSEITRVNKIKLLEETESILEDLIEDSIDELDDDSQISDIIKKFNIAIDKIKI